MSEQYYFAIDGKRNGPVSFEKLREMATRTDLKRQHKVWCPGMKQWEPASVIEKLFEDLPPDLEGEEASTLPPPLPTRLPELQASEQAKTPPLAPALKPGTQTNTTLFATRNVFAILGAIACLMVAFPPVQTYQAPELIGGRSPNPNYEGDVGEPGLLTSGGYRDKRFAFLLTLGESDKIVFSQLVVQFVGLSLVGLATLAWRNNRSVT